MKKQDFEPIVRIVGLGSERGDGHTRITQGDNFHVVLGSDDDHRKMVEACTAINEKLAEKGLHLEDVSHEEFAELLQELDPPDQTT